MSTQLLNPPGNDDAGSLSDVQQSPSTSNVPKTRAEERADVIADYLPSNLRWDNVDWVVVFWIAAMHVGAVAAPFFFTWEAFGATLVFHWLTCSIGICLGYHRFLSHRSLKLVAPARAFVTLCGVLSGEGSPLTWAAVHRIHHAKSDQEGDPHSPLVNVWWSHLYWLFVYHDKKHNEALYRQYVPDLAADPMMQFFEKTYGYILFASAVAMYLIGGWPLLLWGCCARMVFAYHSTWFVNSATHLWGYRNYETTDESRNLWWVAVLSYGEGWHNNHHAHPATARAGHKWWEFDPTWLAIKSLRALGLAYDVNDRNPSRA